MQVNARLKTSFKDPPLTSLSGNARAVFGDIVYETHHHYLAQTAAQDVINQKLLSAVVNVLDLSQKIKERVSDGDPDDFPPYFRDVEQSLSPFVNAVEPIKAQALSNTLPADVCTELSRTFGSVQADLERLHTYVSMSKPTAGATRLNRFSFAVQTILKYDEKVAEVLQKVRTYLDTLQTFGIDDGRVPTSLRSVDEDKVDLAKQLEQDNIKKWLDGQPRDSYIDTCISRRVSGTCEWILQTPAFLDWSSLIFADENAKVFFATAAPGRGKSFIAANVISSLEKSRNTVAAVFWTSEAKYSSSTLDEIPRSWLLQLLAVHPELYTVMRTIWSHSKTDRANSSDVWTALREVLISVRSEQPLTLCIDGLDEYNQQQSRRNEQQNFSHQTSLRYESLSSFLNTLKSTIRGTCCRLWCTSQPDPEIRAELSVARLVAEGFQAFEHNITQEDVKEDIVAFARSVIESKLPKKSAKLKDDLAQLVTEKAEGQMLWISLKDKDSQFLRPSYSENKCRKVVEDTPQGLEHIFKANLDRIDDLPDFEKSKAYAILAFVRDAIRPLTVHEMVEALLIEDDNEFEEVPEDELPDDPDEEDVYGELMRLCGSFIAFDIDDDRKTPQHWKLRFSHSSIRVYITKVFKDVDDSVPSLAKQSLRYLMCTNVWPDAKSTGPAESIYRAKHPFLPYAGSHFCLQVTDGNRQELEPLLETLLVEKWEPFASWYDRAKQIKTKDRARLGLSLSNDWVWESRVALAAAMGLRTPLEAICHLPECSDCKAKAPGLVAACWQGDLALCELMVDCGAQVNVPRGDGQLGLTMAASKGHKEIASYLLTQGADVNASQDDDATPLMLALRAEQTEMAELLLQHGADPTAFDANAVHPLLDAVRKSNTKMVKWFLSKPEISKHEFINRRTHRGDFPLLSNSWWGGADITQELLKHGADINQIGFYGRTPLYTSALRGHEDVFMLLLTHLEDPAQQINATTEWEGTSILIAAVKGKKLNIAKKAVELGADVNRLDYRSRSALDWSVWYGLDDIVNYLLTFMNVNPSTSAYKTWMPLHYACSAGKTQLAKLLIEKGADVKAKTSDGCSAIELGCQNGHLDIVQLLLNIPEARETIDDECDSDDSPLAFACAQGYHLIVATLLEAGADYTQTTSTYDHYTALDWALASGNLETVKLLIEKCGAGAFSDINFIGAAAQSGSLEMYEYTRMTWPNALAESDPRRLSVAQRAALGGNTDLLTLVLEDTPHLLRVKQGDESGPLGCALQTGNVDVARALLDMYKKQIPPLSFENEDVFDAIASNEVDCLQLLLDYDKGQVSSAMKEGWTPLMYAFDSGFHELAELLIKNGFDVLQESADLGVTCLHIYAANGKTPLFKFLKDIDWDKALRHASKDGWRPLLTAINCGQSDPCRRFLKLGGADLMHDKVQPEFPMSWSAIAGASALHLAAATANVELARMVVDMCGKTALEWTDMLGATPCHYAAREDQVYMLEYLLKECGADIDATTNSGHTSFMLAVEHDCRNSARVLLSRNCTIPTDLTIRSALIAYAAGSESPFMLELLLKHGFTLSEYTQPDNVTLLHHALSPYADEDSDNIGWMLEQGQSWISIDNHGWSAIDILRMWDVLDPELVKQGRSVVERFGQSMHDRMTAGEPAWRKADSWYIGAAEEPLFEISNDGLTVSRQCAQSTSAGQPARTMCGITANHPLLPTREDSYFEIAIEQCIEPCAIAIGVEEFVGQKTRMPGFVSLLFGDTGYYYWDPFTMNKYAEPFKQGDVIGCGIDYHAGSLFFTYNGECRGSVTDNYTVRVAPSLYTMGDSMRATINFGDTKPFLFDLSDHGYGSKACKKCYTTAGKLDVKCNSDDDDTTSKTLKKIKKS